MKPTVLWCVIGVGALVFGSLGIAFGVPWWLQFPMMFWLGSLIAYTQRERQRRR